MQTNAALFALTALLAACAGDIPAPNEPAPASVEDGVAVAVVAGGLELSIVVAPSDAEPDLRVAEASMFVPSGLDAIRGVVVLSRAGAGTENYEHPAWRAAAARDGYALVDVDLRPLEDEVSAWRYPDQAASLLLAVVDELEGVSGLQGLAEAPLVPWGHSAGAFMMTPLAATIPERVAGFVAFHGAVNTWAMGDEEVHGRLMGDAFLAVPGLVTVGELDADGIATSAAAFAEEGTDLGAHWAFAVDPDSDHWGYEVGLELVHAFVAEALATWEGAPVEPWVGYLDHHRALGEDGTGRQVVESCAIGTTSSRSVLEAGDSWLPSADFALRWHAHHDVLVGAAGEQR